MNNRALINLLSVIVLSSGWLISSNLHAANQTNSGYTIEDLRLGATTDLVDVCAVESTHTDFTTALAFCYGFVEGATHYHRAISGLDDLDNILCIPPDVTRTQAVAVFIEYSRANPQYGTEAPIDGMFRALVDKWPCAE